MFSTCIEGGRIAENKISCPAPHIRKPFERAGGEPGVYPFLSMVLKAAKAQCDIVKVVTNGNAFVPCFNMFVDKWHVSVTDRNKHLLDMAKYMPNTVGEDIPENYIYDESRGYWVNTINGKP